MITLQLEVGQIYVEHIDGTRNQIEILSVDNEFVRYRASEGRVSSYRTARNRFEGLVRGGVFVPVPPPVVSEDQRRVEVQRQTIRRLECENLALKNELTKVKRQLVFIAERIKL